jgi:hypothetical protein
MRACFIVNLFLFVPATEAETSSRNTDTSAIVGGVVAVAVV